MVKHSIYCTAGSQYGGALVFIFLVLLFYSNCDEQLFSFFLIIFYEQFLLQVYLGEQYVNNATLSDVTFVVEGSE